MVTKDLLRRVIYDQRELMEGLGVDRQILKEQIAAPEILVISGVRRCGKSVLMQQIKAKREEQDYYLSFDDDRLLHFEVEDFQVLYDVFVEDFGMQHSFYLDEVQLIPGWERFVDMLYSHKNKVFVTFFVRRFLLFDGSVGCIYLCPVLFGRNSRPYAGVSPLSGRFHPPVSEIDHKTPSTGSRCRFLR